MMFLWTYIISIILSYLMQRKYIKNSCAYYDNSEKILMLIFLFIPFINVVVSAFALLITCDYEKWINRFYMLGESDDE